MNNKHQYKRKPRKCPECNSVRIATIFWGMPSYSPKLKTDMELGKIVIGECCVTDGNLTWQCADC